MSKYGIAELLGEIDGKFAEEAADISQFEMAKNKSDSQKRLILHRSAKIFGNLGAAAVIALTAAAIVKYGVGDVPNPSESGLNTDINTAEENGALELLTSDQLKENQELYRRQLADLSDEKTDFSEAVLENLTSSQKDIKNMFVNYKSDLSAFNESLLKIYIGDYDPACVTDIGYNGDNKMTYCDKTGFFQYYDNSLYSPKSSLNILKSYFTDGMGGDTSEEKYIVEGKELSVTDMIDMAEATANKGAKALNSPIEFKAVKLNIYEGKEGISFCVYFNLTDGNTEICGLSANGGYKGSFDISDSCNIAVFDKGELSHIRLNFAEKFEEYFTEDGFCSPIYAAKQLKRIVPDNRSYKIKGITLVNICEPYNNPTGDKDRSEKSSPYWLFYTESGITAGLVNCRTGEADFVMTDAIVLKSDFYK